ncbi:MAG: hypothetical protein AB7V53_17075 [Dongiaceae bacterium]
MSFRKLVQYTSQMSQFPVPVDDVRKWLIDNAIQDVIDLFPVDMDPKIVRGSYRRFIVRDAMYGDQQRITHILHAETLNFCWTRFVCCKEMVHAFDQDEQMARDRELASDLITMLVGPAGAQNAIPQVASDHTAQIKALMVLAPLNIVNQLKPAYLDESKSPHDIALFLRIPEAYISYLMSDHFPKACGILTR